MKLKQSRLACHPSPSHSQQMLDAGPVCRRPTVPLSPVRVATANFVFVHQVGSIINFDLLYFAALPLSLTHTLGLGLFYIYWSCWSFAKRHADCLKLLFHVTKRYDGLAPFFFVLYWHGMGEALLASWVGWTSLPRLFSRASAKVLLALESRRERKWEEKNSREHYGAVRFV